MKTKKITLQNFNIFVRVKLNPLEWVLVTYMSGCWLHI